MKTVAIYHIHRPLNVVIIHRHITACPTLYRLPSKQLPIHNTKTVLGRVQSPDNTNNSGSVISAI